MIWSIQASFQAAVAFVEGVEHRPAAGPEAEAGALEVLAHGLEGVAVVGLQHQEIVSALGPDPLGDPLLAAHRVQGHDAAFELESVEQLGDGRDLVRLAVDRALPERQPLLARPSACGRSDCAAAGAYGAGGALTRCS